MKINSSTEKKFNINSGDETLIEKRRKLAMDSLLPITEENLDSRCSRRIEKMMNKSINEKIFLTGFHIESLFTDHDDFENCYLILSEIAIVNKFKTYFREFLDEISYTVIEELSHSVEEDYDHPKFPCIRKILKPEDVGDDEDLISFLRRIDHQIVLRMFGDDEDE
ncbi:MAG: hypothetical protein ACXQS8_06930 [Candidatus Helarchaeales archaeon]